MLFERFVFVLYLLFMYSCFLLGTLYSTSFRFVPLIGMSATLLSVIIVTLFQLQKIVRERELDQSDRWSTVAWSSVHVLVSLLFIMDGLEWVNVMIVLYIAGIFLSALIVVVGICSCYVIIQNSREWTPHVHLTCICFWIFVQYMSVRLPMEELRYVTTVPVVAMAFLRASEHVEDGPDVWSLAEMLLWILCIGFHVFLDAGVWYPETFYWCLLAVVCCMAAMSKHVAKLGMLCVMPFALMPLAMYACLRYAQGYRSVDIGSEITKLYDELTAAPALEPLELSDIEDDYETPL